eukprot:TRINITY_DN18861_c0_g1_i1.p2 TRINITY_DN18861_c0_g1~~TRINITY_DN18861_c0_g1_i1.p2  ORF type:complete len:112 (+),score=2.45 TRINITY_DN18861_c0_g1_i1:298-633(+)
MIMEIACTFKSKNGICPVRMHPVRAPDASRRIKAGVRHIKSRSERRPSMEIPSKFDRIHISLPDPARVANEGYHQNQQHYGTHEEAAGTLRRTSSTCSYLGTKSVMCVKAR